MGLTPSSKPQVVPVFTRDLLLLCNASALVSEEVLLPYNYAYSKQEAVKTKPSDST